MADEKNGKVRYRVTGQCFVGGNFVDPKGRTDVFVWDAPGLAGPSLALAPETAAPGPAANADPNPVTLMPAEKAAEFEKMLVEAQQKLIDANGKLIEAHARIDALGQELDAAQKKVVEGETVIAELQKQLQDQAALLEAAQAATAKGKK